MIPLLRHRNGILYIDNTPLQEGAFQETYITTALTAASSTTLTVRNISGFAINQLILIEDIGTENAEIVKTHTATAPTGSTVTLTAAVARNHDVGARVYIIAYDQIHLLRGTTTAAGSAASLTTTLGSGLVAVQPDKKIQKYEETEFTSGYYFARYKDSIGGTFSGYTDALAYGGWSANTVGYMIERSLRDAGIDALSEKITKEDCYAWLTEGLSEMKGKQIKFAEHAVYNYIAGQLTAGTFRIAMPSDAYDTESNRSLFHDGVRIGNGDPLTYRDPMDFDELQGDAVYTTTRAQALSGATSLSLSNSYDFASSGTVAFWVAGTRYTITYTGVTRDTATGATGALTGVPASGDGSITVTIPSGTYIWQDEQYGEPSTYTVRNGYLEVWPIAGDEAHNENVYVDYSTVVTAINSDGDTTDMHRFDVLQPYLTWRIWCKARNNDLLDLNSAHHIKYKERMNDAIRTSPRNIRNPFKPRINRMYKR